MKTASIPFLVAMSLCLTPAAFGQSVLDDTKVQDIIKQLLSQPRTTWISTGTIQGTHYEEGGPKTTDSAVIQEEIDEAVEKCKQKYAANPLPDGVEINWQKLEEEATEFNVRYDLENKYTMTATETVKYDGQRFSWEVEVLARSDSMAVDSALAGNCMVRHYDVHKEWNQQRRFAWNGAEYTCSSVSGKYTAVHAADTIQERYRPVNGPLTAGLIPWGNGKFSQESLSAADVSAEEINLEGATYVQMTVSYSDGCVADLVLDPLKDYAVTSATVKGTGRAVTYTCSGYRDVDPSSSRCWVPTTVEIERDVDDIHNQMPTLEIWSNLTVASMSTPSLSSFDASPALDATVEYMSPATSSSVLYVDSYEVDTDKLLAERLAYGAAEGTRPQNCATAAFQYVASELGRSVAPSALADLVGDGGRTSLYDLKQAAQKLGLYASAVTTDLAALKTLGTAKVILHLPAQNHFVVLDRLDDRSVWLIDLSGRKFYYRQSAYLFPMDWSAGTALVISDQPVSRQLPELSDAAAKGIAGGYWSCNTKYQDEGWIFCDWVPYVSCDGAYQYLYERWVCRVTSSGSCSSSSMLLRQVSPCVPDPILDCIITGVWTYYYIRGCL